MDMRRGSDGNLSQTVSEQQHSSSLDSFASNIAGLPELEAGNGPLDEIKANKEKETYVTLARGLRFMY